LLDLGGDINDTWEWNGEFWTQIADIGPANRRDHALCFDSVRQTALLFGGLSEQGNPLGDTWSWNGEDWTQLDDSGPSARKGHAMVFDSARGRAVLFGGDSAAGVVNDTWEWDGQAWTQQQDTAPSPRWHHALGFDLVRNGVVLFGGDSGNIMLLELFEFCRGLTRKQTERGEHDNCNYGVTHSGVQCPQLPEGDRNRLEKGRPTIRLDTTLFLCALVL
jgi:hypothetical protein